MFPCRLKSGRWWGAAGLGAAVVSVAAFAGAAPAVAAKPVTVCPAGCDFTAIADAVAAVPDGGVIQVNQGTYAGGFTIGKSVTIRGAGASETTIAAEGPVVTVSPNAHVTIRDVTITNDELSFSPDSGVVNAGKLQLVGATITRNRTLEGAGGGISNTGTLLIKDSAVTGNFAPGGGGIFNDGGDLTIHASTIADNHSFDGGGILTAGGSVTVDNTTISGNGASDGGSGAGIFKHAGGDLTIHASTISHNGAFGFGGGIFSEDNQLTVRGTTITGNSADLCGGGIAVFGDLTSAFRGDAINGNTAGRLFEDIFNPPTDHCPFT